MAHHSVVITFPNLESLNKHAKFFKRIEELLENIHSINDITVEFLDNQVWINNGTDFWDYQEAVYELFKHSVITNDMVEEFKEITKLANIHSDCWNPCDTEYGPDSWEDLFDLVRLEPNLYKNITL